MTRLVTFQSFRYTVHQVMVLQKTTRCFIQTVEEAKGSSFWGGVEVSGFQSGEPVYEEIKGKKKKKKRLELAFDTNFFKSRYEFTFPEKAIEVALRRPEDRSTRDIRFIRSMMMGILSFRRYSTQMQHLLARVVYYRRFGRGRVIVRKGHRGDSFYFLFSGVIAVTQDEDGSSALLDLEPILLHKGASFGEVALLKGLRRNATVVCMEDTEFLVVDRKEFFENKMDQELQKELQYRFQFFRSLDLFSTWSDQSLETLADHCKTEDCHHSQVIVSDTHETKNIVFVTKGRGEVLRLVDLSQCLSFLKWVKQHKALLGGSALASHPGMCDRDQGVGDWGGLSWPVSQSLSFLPPALQRDPRPMVIISSGAEVIRIKLDKFSELADLTTLRKLKERIAPYPSDNDLCRIFLEQNRWKVFKSDLISDLSCSASAQHTQRQHRQMAREAHKGQSADRRGILQLGTHQTKTEQFWTTPTKNKSLDHTTKDAGNTPPEQTPIRLIHGIDIPKLCGKRIMW
ncbi:cyclic nucleotide-binding domain-containing protein 2-like [Pseudophryne corroboree]|uniref:cyclic nucleotide-binding domain-containing protein 2-like n=1 Tax=Pseudophryne corroboree TaxID=495146 RepID=UPI003081C8E7